MLTLCLVSGVGFAQQTPAITPVTAPHVFDAPQEIFSVRNIEVDEKAATTSAARDVALQSARRMAFNRLIRRLVPAQDHARLAFLTDDALANLITDFEVIGEKSSGQRYLARLDIRFDPKKVRTLFHKSNIRHSETGSKPVLVIPVYDGPGHSTDGAAIAGVGRFLWGLNIWRDVISTAIAQTGAADDLLMPLVLPTGDLADVSAVTADQAIMGDMQRLNSLMQRYGTAEILLLHNAQSHSQTAGGGAAFDVTLRRLGGGEETTRIERFEAGPGETLDALMQRAAISLLRGVQEDWLAQTVLDYGQQALLEVAAPLGNLQEWVALQKRLTQTPMIQRVEVLALSVSGVQVNLHYLGTPEKLVSTLSQQGLTLTQDAGRWLIR